MDLSEYGTTAKLDEFGKPAEQDAGGLGAVPSEGEQRLTALASMFRDLELSG